MQQDAIRRILDRHFAQVMDALEITGLDAKRQRAVTRLFQQSFIEMRAALTNTATGDVKP